MARGIPALRAILLLSVFALVDCGGKKAPSKSGQGGSSSDWTSGDIGAVGASGATSFAAGTFTVSASGSDIWDAADAFRFVRRRLSGDGTLTARVVTLDPTDAWAKAGVMIRESLDPGSKFAMAVVTPSNGVSLQYRQETSQGCGLADGSDVAAPYWVRITRQGNVFTGSASADGASWNTIGSVTVSMGADAWFGLCVTAHNNSLVATATFDSVTWTGNSPGGGSFDLSKLGPDVYLVQASAGDGMHGNLAGIFIQVVNPATVPAGNHAPSVTSVTATPPTVAPFGSVQLSASASDADGDPLRFAWVVPSGENTCSPTSSETWTAPSQPGTYTLLVYVSDGHVWSQSSVNVQVTGSQGTNGTGNHSPEIRSLTASSVSVLEGQSVTLTVSAGDPEGEPIDYGWTAAGGGTITGTGPTVTWTAPSPGSGRVSKAGLWIWNRTLPSGCPVALSTDLPGIALVGRASVQHFCDTWMPTWAADGAMYSPWQDGVLLTPPYANLGGWHAGDATALNGWAKIVGDDPQDLLIPLAGELAGPKGNWSGRYPAAIFHHNGVLYYGVRSTAVYDPNGNLSNDANTNYRYASGTFIGWYTSSDGGQSWSAAPNPNAPLFPEPNGGNLRLKFGQPYMVDFGRNQERSPDGKVYFVSSGSTDTSAAVDHLNDDQVYLCRVTPSIANINDLSKYEFYAGNGNWTSTLSNAQPIFEWRNHVNGATMTWNPGLSKYLLFCYKNGYTVNGTKIEWGDFDTYVLESSQMTGPWKLVHYFPSWGTQGYYPNLPTKFLSGDGRNGWMWYGANFAPFDRTQDPPGSGYHLVEQRIRFLTAADTP